MPTECKVAAAVDGIDLGAAKVRDIAIAGNGTCPLLKGPIQSIEYSDDIADGDRYSASKDRIFFRSIGQLARLPRPGQQQAGPLSTPVSRSFRSTGPKIDLRQCQDDRKSIMGINFRKFCKAII